MTLDAAPTPCRRTGFHIKTISVYLPAGRMIMSPGIAASIADWIVWPVVKSVGFLPPMVTVTASIEVLPLPFVITS